MKILFLSCKKASELIDKKQHSPLGKKEHLQLYFHTQMCEACKAYEFQSSLIENTLQEHYKHASLQRQELGYEELKKKIKSKLS